MQIDLESRIVAVTVFPDQARVTVEGNAELPDGIHRLIINELPIGLLAESVRVSGRGEADVRIQGVDVTTIHYEETPSKLIQSLMSEIETLEYELAKLSDEASTIKAQLEYLNGLRSETKEYARALSRSKADVDYQASLTNFFREQDRQLRLEARELSNEEKTLERRLKKLNEDLEQNRSAKRPIRRQILVDVEVASTGSFQLEASYIVRDASWDPLYDVRLSTAGEKPSLEITSLAQVVQETGQDWTDIALTISTTRPAINQRIPILNPWYVGPPEPRPMRSRGMPMVAASPAQAEEPEDTIALSDGVADEFVAGHFAGDRKVARHVFAEAGITELAVVYHISRRSDIPSDASPRKVTLAENRFEPELDYLAIPKHTNAVYRRIKAVNNSSVPLLPGSASLFSGEDYVGNTEMEFVPIDAEFELLIGVEDSIVVKRELVQQDVDKVRLRDRRQLSYGQKIEFNNLLQKEVKIELQDHIPTSRHEDIKVRLLEAQPEPSEQTDLNMLTWEITVQAGEDQVIQYVYRVDHPRDMHVVGLGRR